MILYRKLEHLHNFIETDYLRTHFLLTLSFELINLKKTEKQTNAQILTRILVCGVVYIISYHVQMKDGNQKRRYGVLLCTGAFILGWLITVISSIKFIEMMLKIIIMMMIHRMR